MQSDEEKRLRRNERQRVWYAANKEKQASYMRTWRKRPSNSGRNASYARKKRYGLTQDQFDEMLTSQNAECAICRASEPGAPGTFRVDHCHSSGKVRGLLCHHCNLMLGNARDNTAYLQSAIGYLNARH